MMRLAAHWALTLVHFTPEMILEISCHPCVATMTLAEATRARSTATYTVEAALDNLLSGFGAGGT